ncbi:hypothetical protein [Cupriavidus sp. UBA2534]|uniref:hypothetical protein n=1 Tax=Cupriavidus sp. UBA2534 TaxID=1946399 RepID=UPI000E7D77E0|nr:hypothetical protein [Cupriavidus sp. UBA2534]HBO82073.1 hypothetical protein [Cupriavidus sp.]
MNATANIHQVKLKTRKEMERTIPREKLGWWHDVCPGQRLTLRDATEADIARCMMRKGSSLDPADYLCELGEDGSLVNKLAIDSMHTYAVPAAIDAARLHDRLLPITTNVASVIGDAAALIEREAASLAEGHTYDGEWPAHEDIAKAAYDEMLARAAALRGLLPTPIAIGATA